MWEHVVKAAHIMEGKEAEEEWGGHGQGYCTIQAPGPGTYFLQLGSTS